MDTHKNRLGEAILMSTHNLCFYGEIANIIPKLSLNTRLICSTELVFYFLDMPKISTHIKYFTRTQVSNQYNLNTSRKMFLSMLMGDIMCASDFFFVSKIPHHKSKALFSFVWDQQNGSSTYL